MTALYLYINLFAISFPLFRSFEKKVNYSGNWKSLFPAIVLTGLFFIIWDVIFTKDGVWGFNPDYLVGVNILNLPMEEWLFFITIPFASVFIYECVLYFIPKEPFGGRSKYFLTGLAVLLIIIGALNFERAYTFWNFVFAGGFILITQLLLGFKNPDRFTISYFIHLIPFLLVNGVLTGSFIEEPVVWYNNDENVGVRIFTIPIEDTIYALLLLYMNISFFERFKNVFQVRKKPVQSTF